ncbi:MAG: hypothetical protein M3517_02280 [Actinomycetota bacterium]|nr:hypothetical protein [Actinomycetota bacterium]
MWTTEDHSTELVAGSSALRFSSRRDMIYGETADGGTPVPRELSVPEALKTMLFVNSAYRGDRQDAALPPMTYCADLAGLVVAVVKDGGEMSEWWMVDDMIDRLPAFTDPVTAAYIEMSSSGTIDDLFEEVPT